MCCGRGTVIVVALWVVSEGVCVRETTATTSATAYRRCCVVRCVRVLEDEGTDKHNGTSSRVGEVSR